MGKVRVIEKKGEPKPPVKVYPPYAEYDQFDMASYMGLTEGDVPPYVTEMLANMRMPMGSTIMKALPPPKDAPLSEFVQQSDPAASVEPTHSLCLHCSTGWCTLHGVYGKGKPPLRPDAGARCVTHFRPNCAECSAKTFTAQAFEAKEVPGGATQDPSNPTPAHGPTAERGERSVANPDGYL